MIPGKVNKFLLSTFYCIYKFTNIYFINLWRIYPRINLTKPLKFSFKFYTLKYSLEYMETSFNTVFLLSLNFQYCNERDIGLLCPNNYFSCEENRIVELLYARRLIFLIGRTWSNVYPFIGFFHCKIEYIK